MKKTFLTLTFILLSIIVNAQDYYSNLPDFKGFEKTFTYSPILKEPDINSEQIGKVENTTVEIIKKINNKYYLVKSGKTTGYLWSGWFDLEQKKEKEDKERRIEEEKQRKIAEENRRRVLEDRNKLINSIDKGDVVCYSEDWQHSEFFGLWRENYKMVATMIVDDVTSGGKIILTVNNITSSSRDNYASMKYGRLEIKENQKISITKEDMVHNNAFQFCQ